MEEKPHKIRALAGKLLTNENYTLALLTLGVPAIFYIYVDWRSAFAVFVLSQAALGIIRERR